MLRPPTAAHAPRLTTRPGRSRVARASDGAAGASPGCGRPPVPRLERRRSPPARARRGRPHGRRAPRAWESPRAPCPARAVPPTRSPGAAATLLQPAAPDRPSGREVDTALGTARSEDCPSGARPHPQAEAVGLRAAAVVRLERAFAHWEAPVRTRVIGPAGPVATRIVDVGSTCFRGAASCEHDRGPRGKVPVRRRVLETDAFRVRTRPSGRTHRDRTTVRGATGTGQTADAGPTRHPPPGSTRGGGDTPYREGRSGLLGTAA